MIVDGTPAYSFTSPFSINGLCSYSESCFSKDCKANVSISVNSIIPQPYCSEYGVTLSATGTGIAGQSSYTWKLPDGSTVNGPELFATQNGKYIASYHTVPDTCGREDSVTLAFISGCENKLFVPAAFTPNGDNRNDLLSLRYSVLLTFLSYSFTTGMDNSCSEQIKFCKAGMVLLKTNHRV